MNEFRVTIPEGMEIDKENSTFECIKFKKKEPERWIDQKYRRVDGYYIDLDSTLRHVNKLFQPGDQNVFATKKQANSVLAFAQLTQILANDKRFDSYVSKVHDNPSDTIYTILYNRSTEELIYTKHNSYYYGGISFRKEEQADLFIEENEQLLKEYFMI